MLKLLAFDYGASSGRAILGRYDGNRLELEEVHRFPNEPVMVCGTFYWDILRLFHEMKRGILKCVKAGNGDLAGIGTDTWGVDFGLLDKNGSLLGNPVHYRDKRTEGMIEKASGIVTGREIYEHTGIQFMQFNTLFQLLSLQTSDSPVLQKAACMLFTPDLLNYFLTGEKATEYTIASTSQMLDARNRGWAGPLLKKLNIPLNILNPLINPGTIIGKTDSQVGEETGVKGIPVIAVAGHDTASAVVSVPATGNKFAYLSSGTWSLLGVELDSPVISDVTYELEYTNEGGFNRKTLLLKNIMGLWIYQECMRYWDKTGEALGYDELEKLASGAKPFISLIDPDNMLFYSPGNMPEKIREFCRRSGQPVPGNKAEIVRCIMESLALKYRSALEGLEKIVSFKIPTLHVVGGGCKNAMLCQYTASALNRQVIAGPVEATAAGNLSSQLIALGEVSGLKQAREIIGLSFPEKEYLPINHAQWDDAYGRFINIIGKHVKL